MTGLVAVTGATGFIGRNLIAALARENWRVRALTRFPLADSDSIQWVTGTLDDSEALRRLVEGVPAIVHCAGRVRGSSPEQFMHTNLLGTRNLVQSCLQSNPRTRFLLVSSLAAREPGLSWYANSKYQGEQCLINEAGALSWTVFRPTAVYGPGDREMRPLFLASRYGVLPVTGRSSARFGLLHVDDLVAAVLAWLRTGTPPCGVYELDDGTPGGYDQRAVAAIASQVWKRPVHVLKIPAVLVRIVAGINLGLARLLDYSPMLTPGKVRELQHHDWVCDNSPLTAALGWRPRRRLNDALASALAPAQAS
jgi:nucleoside-diphosphate-sugar epimerase